MQASTFMKETISKIDASAQNILQRWKIRVNSGITKVFPQRGIYRKVQSYHYWLLTAEMLFLTFIYYFDQTPLANIQFFLHSILTGIHDFHRTLFLIPLLYAAMIFRVRGSLIASLLFLCVVLPRSFLFSPYPDPLFRALVFVIVAAFVSLLVAVELDRVDSEHAKLEQFLAETMKRQEQEKHHLARELHDESIQSLVDISHDIDDLVEEEEKADTKSGLKKLRLRMDAVLVGIRQFIMGIRPPLLEEMGLGPSLSWLVHDIVEERGIKVNVQVQGEPRRLSDIMELNLFRIAQEAVQNAKNHSRATKIDIRLVFLRDKVQLTIQDNGVGFSMPVRENLTTQAKFGIIGMYERAHLFGGSLRVESSWEFGTIVFTEVPLNHANQSQTGIV